jgi:ferredoxin-thioredoxin reductase catalytic subunit
MFWLQQKVDKLKRRKREQCYCGLLFTQQAESITEQTSIPYSKTME